MSVATDGVLKSLGSGRLRFCRPLALVRERMDCPLAVDLPVQPEQPLQVESFLRLLPGTGSRAHLGCHRSQWLDWGPVVLAQKH